MSIMRVDLPNADVSTEVVGLSAWRGRGTFTFGVARHRTARRSCADR